MSSVSPLQAEWLEPDGLGGFASGTVGLVRTRRYHALLLSATRPPTGRVALVSAVDAAVETPAGRFALSSHRFGPDVTHPDGACRVASFRRDPWPRWVFRLGDGTLIEHEVFAAHGRAATVVSWRLLEPRGGVSLVVRPMLSGRDYHSTHHENGAFSFHAERSPGMVRWRPYGSLPEIRAVTDGVYEHAPEWWRNFQYDEERARGLDSAEDLGSPGFFRFDLSAGEALLALCADTPGDPLPGAASAAGVARALREQERARRTALGDDLDRAADAYIVRRGEGRTIVAGYPWFTDWGRDTFIALRGLCLATGRIEDARKILVEWSGAVSEGMLPNLFTDSGVEPEYNSVDASLWYVVAAHELLERAAETGAGLGADEAARIRRAILEIVSGYAAGTRFNIHMDADGLLAAGAPGVQLTWMDAKIGDWVVTARTGKPVEVQALWINSLRIASEIDGRWAEAFDRALRSFRAKFWNESGGCLYDVIDCDHREGERDGAVRPNQILAVGGLPLNLLGPQRARRVVDTVESALVTRAGLRSLAPGEPGYAGRYEGGPRERDAVYHQGTVWPWLLGPFVEAWVRVRGSTPGAKREAHERFVAPLLEGLGSAGLGHIGEIADGDPPHRARGCPFQAWSVGEALRLERVTLAGRGAPEGPGAGRARGAVRASAGTGARGA